ncbi:ribosome biogenesis GTPase Der [Sphingomonas sp. SUN039]|uniref:ribosome biogenesis GTPase Der n=1 Tax=Sphingomonas sp. SUN039 TaxID=2937787 RepID=UPI0021645F9D|nr:ribosome biogenesis GTPase Der [Sphingomonas sp. SUN039]UVO54492.1 ribosome biogenesis GTPase Der [Sphingomonas sp. SUN039]
MSKPTVAIIGRPNVGKSTLFNRLVGKRVALVDDRPGVTRDRREGDAQLLGLEFRIVDTAGFEDEDAATLPGRMRQQTQAAVDSADVALFVIDARAGIVPLDEEIARWLRSSKTPVVLMANKAEGNAGNAGVYESFALGFGEPVPFSAEHGEGLADLFEALLPLVDAATEKIESDKGRGQSPGQRVETGTEALGTVPSLDDEGHDADLIDEDYDDDDAPLKLAIVGRPNAGKSTLVNKLLDEERMITGPEAGITRDSISIDWQWHDGERIRDVRLIDTAGLRRRAKVDDKLEKLSAMDTKNAIDFAEVVVVLLDATRGLEAQDLRIADQIYEEGRAMIFALNKWDTVDNGSPLYQGIRAALDDGFAQVRGVPLLTLSALSGKGLHLLIKVAFETRAAWSRRVSTGRLNRWFERALEANPPPAPGGRRIKLRYATQIKSRPPSFVIFGTRVDELPESYRRYLVNGLRRELDFGAVPIRLTFRAPKNPFSDGKSTGR